MIWRQRCPSTPRCDLGDQADRAFTGHTRNRLQLLNNRLKGHHPGHHPGGDLTVVGVAAEAASVPDASAVDAAHATTLHASNTVNSET